LELLVGGGIMYLVRQRTEPSEQRRTDVKLTRIDDHGREAIFPGRAAGRDHPAEGATDEHDALLVDLGRGRQDVEHLGHDVLPVRAQGTRRSYSIPP
jgi:hypothetical protein